MNESQEPYSASRVINRWGDITGGAIGTASDLTNYTDESVVIYDSLTGVVITAKHLDKFFPPKKICGTCRFWNFKCSNIKAWGQCLNPKMKDNHFISIRNYPKHFEEVKDYHQFRKDVSEGCEVYFEENFGCIHHQKED